MEEIIRSLSDKSIAILGFGKEGRSTLNFLLKYVKTAGITIADKNKSAYSGEFNVEWKLGDDYQEGLEKYDIIIKSPGIVLENPTEGLLQKLTSQTQLMLRSFRERTVGITGTKGKSTTTTLIYHILSQSGADCILMGNIGIPPFDVIEQIGNDTHIIYELSSHQLEYINVSPKYAVLLNVFPEHLDHYGSFEKYYAAKKNIYRHQGCGDLLICDKKLAHHSDNLLNEVITLSENENADIYIGEDFFNFRHDTIYFSELKTALAGRHNIINAAYAFAVLKLLGIDKKTFLSGLASYKPLPHRLEFIGALNGVNYYDDSISTIPETTIAALKSIKKVQTVIIGGMNRGISYLPLAEYLKASEVENIILMYETGEVVFKLLENSGKNIIMAGELKKAAETAREITSPGYSCVLSPAAPSYGNFKNFEERGQLFKEYLFDFRDPRKGQKPCVL